MQKSKDSQPLTDAQFPEQPFRAVETLTLARFQLLGLHLLAFASQLRRAFGQLGLRSE
jgi:hypothetical protein